MGAADLRLGATVDALHTGDLARRNAQGLLELVGRTSRFTKLFGHRIDLDGVERLLADEGVTGMCVGNDRSLTIAVEDERGAVDASSAVCARLGIPVSAANLVLLDQLPRSRHGKLDHGALEQIAERVPHPSTDPGGTVLAAFADVLGGAPTERDSFVSLGGDSLSYAEVSIRVEEVCGFLPPDWHLLPIGELSPTGVREP